MKVIKQHVPNGVYTALYLSYFLPLPVPHVSTPHLPPKKREKEFKGGEDKEKGSWCKHCIRRKKEMQKNKTKIMRVNCCVKWTMQSKCAQHLITVGHFGYQSRPPPFIRKFLLKLYAGEWFFCCLGGCKRERKEGRPGSGQTVQDRIRKTWTKSDFSSPFCFPVRFERNELWNCDFFFPFFCTL